MNNENSQAILRILSQSHRDETKNAVTIATAPYDANGTLSEDEYHILRSHILGLFYYLLENVDVIVDEHGIQGARVKGEQK